MYCDDFIFDGESLSDYGFVICNIDGGGFSWNGGNVTFTSIKSPSSNRFSHYGSSFNDPISFSFQIGLNNCIRDGLYLTQDDESSIMRWLQRTDGYHWLSFKQDGWEDVWFNCQINLEPAYVMNRVAGYTVNATTDSPYGYSQEFSKTTTLSSNGKFIINDYSDLCGKLFVRAEITPKNNGQVKIITGTTDYTNKTIIDNAIKNQKIILDGENDYISGIDNLNNFNFKFPVFSNTYKNTVNEIKNEGVPIDINMKWRYVRRVAV